MERRKSKFLKGIQPLIYKKFEDKSHKIMDDAQKRYEELVEENKSEPKGMHMHTSKIYPAIALYEAVSHHADPSEAKEVLYNYTMRRSEIGAKALRGILKIPGLYKKFPKFYAYLARTSFGESAGFKVKIHGVDKKGCSLDMIQCPYLDLTTKYGCPEICEIFCAADDVVYGDMHPKLIWSRTTSLATGGDCCDFRIEIVDKKPKSKGR